MQYSFTCPSPRNYVVKVDAQNDHEAVDKIIKAGEAHRKQAHPNMPPMTEEQIRNTVRSGMKKG